MPFDSNPEVETPVFVPRRIITPREKILRRAVEIWSDPNKRGGKMLYDYQKDQYCVLGVIEKAARETNDDRHFSAYNDGPLVLGYARSSDRPHAINDLLGRLGRFYLFRRMKRELRRLEKHAIYTRD